MAFIGLLPSFGGTLSQQGGAAYGLLMSTLGLGAILAPLALAAFARRTNERRLLVATAVLSGLTLVLMGAARTLPLAAAVAVTVGASQSIYMTLLYRQSQALSGEAMRGRVAGFTFFFVAGVMGVFNLGFGWLATIIPPGVVMEGMGTAFMVATVVLLARVPVLRWTVPALPPDAGGLPGVR